MGWNPTMATHQKLRPIMNIINENMKKYLAINALLLGKWSYAPTMPLVPYLRVGLMPILQMTLLLPLSFYLAGLLNKKIT